MDKIVPTSPPTTGLTLNKGKLRSSGTPFQQRVNAAKASTPDAASMPNRLCLMLDRSSSMSQYADSGQNNKSKIVLLKEAIDNFVNRCDFNNTSLAIETFPASLELPLTSQSLLVTTSVSSIHASGNTPMRQCVTTCLEKVPMTRGIIVSDGEATDWRDEFFEEETRTTDIDVSILDKYKKAQIPIDCVHIGDSTSGEELLRRIAKETGGLYIKFSDVNAFSKGFAYLTPGYRAMLCDGSVGGAQLGADEVRR
jgi:Mg-chelatase subunit ChlD